MVDIEKMKKEYDFSRGKQGKFFKSNVKLNIPVYLDDDVFMFVNNIAKEKESDISLIVNQLIHSDMQIAKTIG